MKKILLSALAVLLIGLVNTTNAQCTFANPGIRIVAPPRDSAGKCIVRMELSFDILHNPGGKYFWVHLWPTSAYPNYNYPQSHPPTTSSVPGENSALDNSIATFGFFHQGGALDIQTAYPPDNTAPYFQSGYTISEISGGGVLPGSDRYTLNGLTIILPLDCSIPQSFTADLWESQSAQAQTVACVSKGVVMYANDPKVTGFLVCETPRTYNFTITSINTAGIVVSYNVYIDDGDGIYNKALDNINIASGSNLPLDNTNNYRFTSGTMNYLPYSNQKPYADRDLWIVVTSPTISNEVYARLINACIPLSVQFMSFTAVRNHTNVLLRWTTASEHNNNGFAVERNSAGSWQEIAFVPSLATGGNSDIPLNYQYTDINTVKGMTQYRLRQIDFDLQSKYSNIVAVRGENQPGKIIVYPNPSAGSVNIVFETADVARDVSLTDMTGRTIRQWRGLTVNNIRIDDLKPGLYLLRVITIETREQQAEKIVVVR
jgi:Secretion system C-terminal sorting domain